MFKESRFNIHKVVDRVHYVYNVRSEALVRVKHQSLSQPTSADDILVRQGFFVRDSVDEVAALLNARRAAVESEAYQYVRIMTTSCCNARCAYCYERNQPRLTMTHDIAIDVAKFICRSNPRVKILELCWFGGEPFLNPRVIDDIIGFLKFNHPSKDVVIKSSFITNGSLIDDNAVESMVARWNVKEVQISLDGYGRDYERIKGYVDNGITFEHVLGNIEKLVEKNVSTKIRLNVDKRNIDKIKQLVEYLGVRFLNTKSLHVYPGYLFDGENPDNPNLITQEDADIRKELSEFFANNGFRVPLIPRRRNVVCYAGRRNSFFITPDGKVYKCAQHYADKTATPIGTVKDGVQGQDAWIDCNVNGRCEDCIALPVCQGGCRAARLTALGLEQCQSTMADLNNHILALIDLHDKKGSNELVAKGET